MIERTDLRQTVMMELSMEMMMIELTDELQCNRLLKWIDDRIDFQNNNDGTNYGNDDDRFDW